MEEGERLGDREEITRVSYFLDFNILQTAESAQNE